MFLVRHIFRHTQRSIYIQKIKNKNTIINTGNDSSRDLRQLKQPNIGKNYRGVEKQCSWQKIVFIFLPSAFCQKYIFYFFFCPKLKKCKMNFI